MDQEMLREKIAKEYDFALYRQYGEAQAAHIIGVDLSWMKRHRESDNPAQQIPHVKLGPRKIRYFGYMLADILLRGTGCLDTPNGNSSLGDITSPSAAAPPLGIAAGEKVGPQSASASARRILTKQSGS